MEKESENNAENYLDARTTEEIKNQPKGITTTAISEPENWEKEFDKIAPVELEIEGKICDLRPVIIPIKNFIRQTREEALEQGIERGRKINLEEIPMGVSQWRNHGKIFHYWDFWEKRIKQEVLEKLTLPPQLWNVKTEETQLYSDAECVGYRTAVKLLESLKKDIK